MLKNEMGTSLVLMTYIIAEPWLRDFVGVDALNGVPVTIRGFMFDISDTKEDEETERRRHRTHDPGKTPNLVD